MLISEQKPIEEVLAYLEGENRIFIVGCRGCAEGCESGGEKQVLEMEERLKATGKTIAGTTTVDTLCNEALVRMRLKPHQETIQSADSVLVMTCGAGTQVMAKVLNKVVHPGCNTLPLGGDHSEWIRGEYCLECGDCVLDYTGGICPIAGCAKNLLHGPCGGSEGGKCEINPDLPCAWHLIVERLTQLGRLDKLEAVLPPKNWGVSLTGGPPRPR